MTIEEFYKAINEDYNMMLERFGSPERIKKYTLMFAHDDTYANLVKAMEVKDYETAFRMVHTLKGVSSNLCFMQLYNSAVVLTDILRAKNYSSDMDVPFIKVKEEYNKIADVLAQYINQ